MIFGNKLMSFTNRNLKITIGKVNLSNGMMFFRSGQRSFGNGNKIDTKRRTTVANGNKILRIGKKS